MDFFFYSVCFSYVEYRWVFLLDAFGQSVEFEHWDHSHGELLVRGVCLFVSWRHCSVPCFLMFSSLLLSRSVAHPTWRIHPVWLMAVVGFVVCFLGYPLRLFCIADLVILNCLMCSLSWKYIISPWVWKECFAGSSKSGEKFSFRAWNLSLQVLLAFKLVWWSLL